MYRAPKGSRMVFQSHHFSGVNSLLNFGGFSIIRLDSLSAWNPGRPLRRLLFTWQPPPQTTNHLGKWRHGSQHSRHWKKASGARLYSSICMNLILKPISNPKQDGTLNILQKQKSTASSTLLDALKFGRCWKLKTYPAGNDHISPSRTRHFGVDDFLFAKLETLSVEDSNKFEGLYKRSIFISISFFMIQRGGNKFTPFETCFHFNVSECQGVFLVPKGTNGRSSILNSSKPIRNVEDPGSKFRRRADVGKLSSSSGWVIVIYKKTQLFSLLFLGVWAFFGVPVAMNPKPSLSLKALFSGKGGGGPRGQPQARCVLVNSLRWSCQEMAKSYVHLWGVASGSNLVHLVEGPTVSTNKSPVLDDRRI